MMPTPTGQSGLFGGGPSTSPGETLVPPIVGVTVGTKVSRAMTVELGDAVGLGGRGVAVGSGVTIGGPDVSKKTEAMTGVSVPTEVMII
jgi:hypothetical protein